MVLQYAVLCKVVNLTILSAHFAHKKRGSNSYNNKILTMLRVSVIWFMCWSNCDLSSSSGLKMTWNPHQGLPHLLFTYIEQKSESKNQYLERKIRQRCQK